MTDENKNTDTKATTKAETTAKAAPKAKTKPKVKAKQKAVAKSTAKPVEDAPYLKKDSKTEPSHTQSTKRKSSTPVVLLLIVAALILTTTYKFNEERNNLPAQANTHDNSVVAEPATAALQQVVPDNNNIKTSPLQAPEPQTLLTDVKTDGQTEQQVTNNNDLMQQRRQAYEKEIQLKQQQFKALMEARQKERAEIIAKQKAELQRIKQKQLETRVEARAIQQQILDLHEKLHQLMKEAHTQN